MFVKAILFDLDDTLYNYTNAHEYSLNEVFFYLTNICNK
jgi:FMN phosphatase YigB (HAD superfamily)